MEFRKIDEQKFQCLLYEEDLEDNNISLDDFFKNDTEKIHSLLDVVMEEAERNIGIVLDGSVMSLQLAPQPNHSILLTISSGKEDFGNMLRQAGERANQAIASLKPRNNKSNVIKNGSANSKSASFSSFDQVQDIFENMNDGENGAFDSSAKGNSNILKARYAVFRIETLDDFESLCALCSKTWGIANSLYKDHRENCLYLVMEKIRCAEDKYRGLLNILMEYGDFDSSQQERAAWIKEHCECLIHASAINRVKKYI